MRDGILVAKVTNKETRVRVKNDITEEEMWDMAKTNGEQQLEYEWHVTPPQPDTDEEIEYLSSIAPKVQEVPEVQDAQVLPPQGHRL